MRGEGWNVVRGILILFKEVVGEVWLQGGSMFLQKGN